MEEDIIIGSFSFYIERFVYGVNLYFGDYWGIFEVSVFMCWEKEVVLFFIDVFLMVLIIFRLFSIFIFIMVDFLGYKFYGYIFYL